MTSYRSWWLAAVGCFVFLSLGCSDDAASAGGTGGAAGEGGAGGAVGESTPQIPGLWEGKSNGVDVCFYISDDGLELTKSADCNVTAEPEAGSQSYDIGVDLVGSDENGDPCSFELAFAADVIINQETNSFAVRNFQPPGSDVELSFSGELIGDRASGVARSESGGSFCQVGWAATRTAICDEAAIQTCLDLQDCCRMILVNPVFFESCNSVVLQCDQAQCQRVLDGYPRCATEPEP